MISQSVEIVPQILPQKSYLFIRCIEQQYAEAFIERGAMRFARPSDWSKADGTSRGDFLEGVFASQIGFNNQIDGHLRALREKTYIIKNQDFTFYKSKEILSYRAHCVYGLNSNNLFLRDKRSQDHQFHQAGRVKKEFFSRLFPNVTKDAVESMERKDRPVVLFITPHAFISFVKSNLLKRGVREEEIIIRPVTYFDYYQKPFILWEEPMELFSKHISFSEQSEVRIVVDTHRDEVKSLFDNNGVIEFGHVDESIATLSDFYFEDMEVEIRGNLLLYSLAKPVQEPIDDNMMINYLRQTLSDELPDAPMSIERIEENMKVYIQALQRRDVNAHYNWDNHVLYFKGKYYDIGEVALRKILAHYNSYFSDKDDEGVRDTASKLKHFFPFLVFRE